MFRLRGTRPGLLIAVCAVLAAAALVAPSSGGAQGAICPLLTLAPPPAEGQEGFITVGQPNPCPPPERTQSDFEILIDFGDGETARTGFAPGDGAWVIGANHAYSKAGVYTITADVKDKINGSTTRYQRPVPIEIANAPLTEEDAARPRFQAGQRATRQVARFSDGNPMARASDYTAQIKWGDGRTSKGKVDRAGAAFAVRGTHRYQRGRPRRVTVTVSDGAGGQLDLKTQARVKRRSA